MPRFFCPAPLSPGAALDLPAPAARHVQVLRLQPGDRITLFNGGSNHPGAAALSEGEFAATITAMGRSAVRVQVAEHTPVQREAARAVHLALGMPANERMDWLVEKATELGVASIQPLMCDRSVLKLSGDRAVRKQAHWQAIAIAACEQCGRNQVPQMYPVQALADWLGARVDACANHLLLSLAPDTTALRELPLASGAVMLLSGPEGGLSQGEEALALGTGFRPVSLGPCVLRAETAALAALTLLA